MIVFSHGGGARDPCSFGNPEWGTTLAGAGYVVVHISHNLDSQTQSFACGQIGVPACTETEALRYLRPGDARVVIDELQRIATGFGLIDRMNLDKVAIAGHSFGAYTAMTIAGARFDVGTLANQSYADPRITSVLALSPQGPDRFGFFDRGASGNSWMSIAVPVLVQTGAGDSLLGESASDRRIPFRLMPPPDKAEAFLNDPRAMHNTFNLNDPGAPPEFFTWIASVAIAWFDATLQERATAWSWLASDALTQVSGGLEEISRKQLASPAGP